MTAIDVLHSEIAAGERSGPRIVAGTMVDGPSPASPIALPADGARGAAG